MAFQTELTPGRGYGNLYVDSLVWGSQWTDSPYYFGRFSASAPINVRYEFFGDDNEYQGYTFYRWSSAQIRNFNRALETFEYVCNLKFSPSTGVTDLYFVQLDANFFGGTNVLGMCETPDAESDPNVGFFNKSAPQWSELSPGSTGFYVLIHELGHGIGLAHPHDGGTGDYPTKFPGVTSASSLGTYQMNQGIWSMMSYNFNPSWLGHESTDAYGHSMTPMALDIAALQAIYGANISYRTEANLYLLPQTNAAGTGWICIWDCGGVDTISNSGSRFSCTIDLNPAPLVGLNAGGYVSWANGIVGGFTIANGVVIENASGGFANDYIIGNDASNQLGGSLGDDFLMGGGGMDTLFGGQGNDQLRGGKGHDQVNGGNGNDTIRGAKGADTLTGGLGSDVFVFDSILDDVVNIDTITDFEIGIDRIELATAAFSGLENRVGQKILLGEWIRFEADSGALFYNAGNLENPLWLEFAVVQLQANLGVGELDFFVVR